MAKSIVIHVNINYMCFGALISSASGIVSAVRINRHNGDPDIGAEVRDCVHHR